MLATQATVESLAERIERAYRLRQNHWHRGCSAAGVWEAAASALLQIHREDPNVPLDPELFVATQPIKDTPADPWAELTQPASSQRYRDRVRQIIRDLRDELRNEVRLAERLVAHGETLRQVLLSRNKDLSPLGRFIVAQRAGRTDLADRFRAEAVEQHRSCPLYRQACLRLLPTETYPATESAAHLESHRPTRLVRTQVHLN